MSSAPDTLDSEPERIPLLSGDGLTPEQQRVYDAIVSGPRGKMVGPLRAALHSPALAEPWSRLGEQLRYHTTLPPRQTELAIIATARFWNSEVEWAIHAAIATREGVDPAVIEAIRVGQPPVFDDAEDALIYDFTCELLAHGQVGDTVYHALYRRLDAVRMVELTALVGYYTMVAMTLNAHRIPPPTEGGTPLPDGAGRGERLRPTRPLPPGRRTP